MDLPFSIYKRDCFERMFDAIPIIIADRDTGEIRLASRPTELMFGCTTAGELAGKPINEFIPDILLTTNAEHRLNYAADGRTREMNGKTKDGQIITLHILLVPFDLPGYQCVGVIASTTKC